ncbi:MAG TPA: LysM peptidoglycan-binding domain-containing protein [Polyangiaceae bacterium]|nr:LysM peptidoglycan-binding domain-containing protein [Polyangiaceae bacterium]
MKPKHSRIATLLIGAVAAYAPVAAAQDEPTNIGPTQNGEPNVTVLPGPTTTTNTVQQTGPGPGELDSHLPSSSRSLTDTNASSDGFDLNHDNPAAATAKGSPTGQYVLEGGGSGVPQGHTVKRGDTLWGISGQYYKNPYNWPKVWAQNPQIQNPHWIYPGDRVKLRADEGKGGPLRASTLPEKTVFLRSYGWVDDPDKDAVGELVGSPEDQMFLSFDDDVYIELDEDQKVELGQELQLFREIRTLRGREAEGDGELVQVFGTVRVDRYNPKTHMVRAHIIEALDTIERGLSVGVIGRKFIVVPPTKNEKYVEARILTALYPHQFFGQNQIVFLDRGSKEGVKVGNRFIGVRRGDRWVESLDTAGEGAKERTVTEDDRNAILESLKTDGPSDKYPNETFAEVRVLEVREHTCMAIVMESSYEMERDSILVMKKGL